jgi:hypothetical protein
MSVQEKMFKISTKSYFSCFLVFFIATFQSTNGAPLEKGKKKTLTMNKSLT